MLKRLLVLFVVFTSFYSFSQTPVPDANFEQFLVDQGIDTNGLTGDILNVDAAGVTNLNITRNDIIDFSGLEAFTNLATLNAGTNQFPTLPLTTLTNLEELTFRNNRALTGLDLTQNTALRDLEFRLSGIPIASITSLDLSQNLNLESLTIEQPSLTSLTLPVTTTLVDIDIYNCSLPTIDLSQLEGDIDFYIIGSRVDVTIVNPDKKDAIKSFHLSSIDFLTVDVSELIGLETFRLSSTRTETILLPTTNTLTRISISGHELNVPLSFASLPELNNLSITNNFGVVPLVVDLSQNLELTNLDLARNLMNTVDISNNTKLERLDVNTNNLTTIDVSQNVLLENVNVSSNQLPSLDISTNTELTTLNASNNLLPTLDIATNILLRDLDLGFNQLPNLDVTNNLGLRRLNIDNNLFTGTGLDLTQNIDLSSLDASFNTIESLDITQNPELSSLNISDNIFPDLDILNQFYTHQVDQGRLNMALNVENNLLSGRIPDFYGLYDPSVQTRRSSFLFGGNSFEFGDFEDEHLDYVALLTTQSTGPSPDVVFRDYTYAPQSKVNNIETFNRNAGDDITLTTIVSGTQNHYKWFKDGTEITDAPDSPDLILTDLTDCDAGVYYCEVTSDLVPFENANPPGTDGKNLLLVRNDITLNIAVNKVCVALVEPLAGATNVPINTGIEWDENPGACGYKITIRNVDINAAIETDVDVEAFTLYNPVNDLPPNTQIGVTITPYFDDGDLGGCSEEIFTTSSSSVVPSCTLLSNPSGGDTNVPIDVSEITWTTANGADGYRITVNGSTSNANDITDFDTTATSYSFANDFDQGETVTVTIVPYNTAGNATGCSTESFTIVNTPTPTVPACTILILPTDGDTDVAVDTGIQWNAVADTDGYRITVNASTSNANDITDFDTTATSYSFADDFDQGETVTVTIVPYNTVGNATGCSTEIFTTVNVPTPTVPLCTALSNPADGDTDVAVDTGIQWSAVADADGYRLSIGTIPGGTDVLENEDVGILTSFTLENTLAFGQEIFVSVIPYNQNGDATGCSKSSFSTIAAPEEKEVETLFGFSPDGDGINEYWTIAGIEAYPNNTVTIFNRWGDIIFKTEGYDNAGNAFRGEANQLTSIGAGQLPEGTYFFQINIPEEHNLKTTQGYLVLKR